MGFWGIEVKPGKPCPYHSDNVPGKLHVTQIKNANQYSFFVENAMALEESEATLGIGSSKDNNILQCASGHKSPVFLCSLLPNRIESCPLNLKFDIDDLVAFSVIGSRSIHLSGFFAADDGDELKDDYEYDSWGEDIEGTESSEYDSEDEYDNGFIVDSDVDIYQSSPVPNSGVVIEEIVDDEKPESGDDQNKQLKKKKQVAKLKPKDSKIFKSEIVAKGETDLVENEDEDEDGFPISTAEKDVSISQKEDGETTGEQALKKIENANKKRKDGDDFAGVKRKVDSADEDEPQDGKKKKRNKLKERIKEENADASGNSNETNVIAPNEKHPEAVKTTTGQSGVSHAKDENEGKLSNNEVGAEKKNKIKKKKKTKELEGIAAADQITSSAEKQNLSVASEKKGKKQTETKPSQVRTFLNGLVIEELLMGKPDGKRAAPGKKVSVKYIGKLQKDGKIFDSNVGRAPFKFRLGVGQVIKGWEVGINGMRIGDKRRITIPPSMGYADKGVGTIPPNAWLVFDVELVDVDR